MTGSYITRRLDISKTLGRRSVLLLGPRQVGKSSLMKNQLQDQVRLSFNLLDRRISMEASVNPMWMRSRIEAEGLSNCVIAIDEIQKNAGIARRCSSFNRRTRHSIFNDGIKRAKTAPHGG